MEYRHWIALQEENSIYKWVSVIEEEGEIRAVCIYIVSRVSDRGEMVL
jgi:hypothetical protein